MAAVGRMSAGVDNPSALAVDSEGNLYVTGSSEGSGANGEYATVKYSTAGEELWVAHYDGSGGDDEAHALALDDEGNVYVTGGSGGSDTNSDYATVKYSPAGEELWVARYVTPAIMDVKVNGLVLDSRGNVYVTGGWNFADKEWNSATIKYTQGFGPEMLPADCNADGAVDLGDAICLLGYLFGDMPSELPCGDGTVTDAGNVALIDSNGDRGIDLGDPVYVLSYLFADGLAPLLGSECVVIVGCPDVCGALPGR